jgi:hypothetical protein
LSWMSRQRVDWEFGEGSPVLFNLTISLTLQEWTESYWSDNMSMTFLRRGKMGSTWQTPKGARLISQSQKHLLLKGHGLNRRFSEASGDSVDFKISLGGRWTRIFSSSSVVSKTALQAAPFPSTSSSCLSTTVGIAASSAPLRLSSSCRLRLFFFFFFFILKSALASPLKDAILRPSNDSWNTTSRPSSVIVSN